ncbi:Na(+)/H(+) antiporter subunit D [Ferrimonas balearica]|uniref:Na(+)/H(+) antiporter subunit D n=1 Tax=Ferrimonas balearica TaxID=44012 RepID=UPI001C56A48F|nr:Na(+)/H(+) antiporter subunit D [Ferrimonas balearica]MBW3138637.1 Na(+)/H(+) antiporter subunit D [Ferrimonas balearica]MBW3163764.1 Na(+)/H(+) antiporter subunit D [Ferrimonas balearica]MBY6223761.1 Na(+)/H(+) antiporter subunit D [Ferrimonas balearica]
MIDFPPYLLFVIGALLVALVRPGIGRWIALITPLLSLALVWQVPLGSHVELVLMGHTLELFRLDALSRVFVLIFHLAAFLALLFASHLTARLEWVAGLLYSGSAIGAVLAGDMLSLFLFWEGMALSSVWLVWARGTERAYTAGMRYLIVQVVSGLLLLVGGLLYLHQHGTLSFGPMTLADPATWLLFLAFGIKCVFPMLHSWLVDAYPEATPTGTVFLSAFTTKVALYALARGFPGTELLVYIGAAMACFPIFYAVIENDLRRVLAYSLINQVGFMVVGVGLGSELAMNGALAHAVNDILFKGLLFMSMGAVLMMTGKIDGSRLGGLYKTMPKTTILCIVGAASISAFPLFSGFVSKSMVMSAALIEGHPVVWLILLFASAGVFHHAGIKIPYFAFFAHDSGLKASDPPNNMLLAMTIAALFCVAIGIYPQALYQLLPYDTGYWPYDVTHVLAQTQLLAFSALAFVWLNRRGLYPPELPSVNLDADWLYRGIGYRMGAALWQRGWALQAWLGERAQAWRQSAGRYLATHVPEGQLGGSPLSGAMVIWVAVILAGYLLLSFLPGMG